MCNDRNGPPSSNSEKCMLGDAFEEGKKEDRCTLQFPFMGALYLQYRPVP
jgi:hypothetical protein